MLAVRRGRRSGSGQRAAGVVKIDGGDFATQIRSRDSRAVHRCGGWTHGDHGAIDGVGRGGESESGHDPDTHTGGCQTASRSLCPVQKANQFRPGILSTRWTGPFWDGPKFTKGECLGVCPSPIPTTAEMPYDRSTTPVTLKLPSGPLFARSTLSSKALSLSSTKAIAGLPSGQWTKPVMIRRSSFGGRRNSNPCSLKRHATPIAPTHPTVEAPPKPARNCALLSSTICCYRSCRSVTRTRASGTAVNSAPSASTCSPIRTDSTDAPAGTFRTKRRYRAGST